MSSIKIRTKQLKDNTQIRVLITHPMANGRGKDTQGNIIPAHHITVLTVTHNTTKILSSHLSGSISKNPYFDFLLKGDNKGDTLSIHWTDNLGKTDSAEYTIK